MRAADAHTVRLHEETLTYNDGYERTHPKSKIYGYGRNVHLRHFPWPKRPWPKCPGRYVLGRNVRGRNVRATTDTCGHFKLQITKTSNNFVICSQKHKVWVLVFLLERAEHFESKIEQIRRNFLSCNKTASSTAASPFTMLI